MNDKERILEQMEQKISEIAQEHETELEGFQVCYIPPQLIDSLDEFLKDPSWHTLVEHIQPLLMLVSMLDLERSLQETMRE